MKKPYSERTDLERLESNWRKSVKLFQRDDFSGALVRATTAIEISANLLIREELVTRKGLEAKFVDSLMLWANGINGKFNKIILPYFKADENRKGLYEVLKGLKGGIEVINKERNLIVHTGKFKNKEKTLNLIRNSQKVIKVLLEISEKKSTEIEEFTL